MLDTCARSRSRTPIKIRKVMVQANRLCREEEGKDSVEYTLLLVLVALGAIAAIVTVAKALGLFLGPTATSQTTR